MEEMAGVNPPSFPARDAASILEAAGLPVEV
jgi:glyceraldehyde 3-phosphate dehydrogenase